MRKLIDYAKTRGYRRLWGSVAVENRRMLDLARELGFRPEADPADAGLVRAILSLT